MTRVQNLGGQVSILMNLNFELEVVLRRLCGVKAPKMNE